MSVEEIRHIVEILLVVLFVVGVDVKVEEEIWKIEVFELRHPEVLFDFLPYILLYRQDFEKIDKLLQLIIFWIIPERNDRNAIIQLIAEGINSIIHNDNVFQVDTLKYPEVLDIELSCEYARRSVEPMMEQLVLWVDVVQNCVCVRFHARSESDHFEKFAGFQQAFSVGFSEVEADVYALASDW